MFSMVTLKSKIKSNVWYEETKDKTFFMWHMETLDNGFVDFSVINKDGKLRKMRKAIHNLDVLSQIETIKEVSNPEVIEILYGSQT